MNAQQNTERIYEDPNKLVFIQSRAATNEEWIAECIEMMQSGIEFDPVQAVQDESGQIFVHDGLHRGEAAKRLGSLLSVEVRPGTREKAEWLALSANQKHGLKRTRADKQKVVRGAFLHTYGAQFTDREIARHCGVDHKTVGKIRKEMELSGEIPQIDKRMVVRGDQTYEQDTGQIGGSDEAKYMPVWELERAISTWPLLRNPVNDLNDMLADIKDETPEGRRYFFDLQQHLNTVGRYRQRDLRQACNNLLEQLRQQRGGDDEPALRYRLQTVPSAEINRSDDHSNHTPKAQDSECPRCGQEKIVGINGSQRWCLNCGAEWPTAAEFLSEVNTVASMATPVRTRLQARFAGLLTKLTDEKLSEIDAWLDELEGEVPLEVKGKEY